MNQVADMFTVWGETLRGAPGSSREIGKVPPIVLTQTNEIRA